jgi:hypothetical protein
MARDDRARSVSHDSPLASARGGMIGGIFRSGRREDGSLKRISGYFAVPATAPAPPSIYFPTGLYSPWKTWGFIP